MVENPLSTIASLWSTTWVICARLNMTSNGNSKPNSAVLFGIGKPRAMTLFANSGCQHVLSASLSGRRSRIFS